MRDWIKRYWQERKNQPEKQAFWARLYNKLGRNQFSMVGEENTFQAEGALIFKVHLDLIGNQNSITIGPGTRLSNLLIRVRGDQHQIVIGKNCAYQAGEIWIEDHHTCLNIGDETTIVKAHLAVTEPESKIEIGQRCMFAHDIELRCGDSHSIIDLESGERINYAENICLGRHVWVTVGVTILKGVEIGNNCVIASQALVTKSFPSNCLIGGVPAKILRENITWRRKRIYENNEVDL